MEHQLAAGCGRINGFGDALESDPLGFQLGHQLDQVLERSAQPVEPPDREHVARSECIVHTLQAGALHLAPLTVSSMIFSHPARVRASRFKSRFCSVVETRAYPIRIFPPPSLPK